MLAFKAVQRQSAASRSISPPSNEQQCESGGLPTMVPPTDPLRTLTHIPSLRASLGQFPFDGFGVGFGGLGTLETRGNFLATVIENYAECNRNVKVYAQHIGSDGSAKTKCSLEMDKAIDEAAAWQLGRGSNDDINERLGFGLSQALTREKRTRSRDRNRDSAALVFLYPIS
ncbi:hypothetical protein AgCh_021335 [Apium graveolens]